MSDTSSSLHTLAMWSHNILGKKRILTNDQTKHTEDLPHSFSLGDRDGRWTGFDRVLFYSTWATIIQRHLLCLILHWIWALYHTYTLYDAFLRIAPTWSSYHLRCGHIFSTWHATQKCKDTYDNCQHRYQVPALTEWLGNQSVPASSQVIHTATCHSFS